MPPVFRNFIAGEWVEPSTGDYFDNVNPADTSDVVGRFPLSGIEDVERAVESAQRGFDVNVVVTYEPNSNPDDNQGPVPRPPGRPGTG